VSPDRRILVTGGTGILGTAIRDHIPRSVAVFFPTRQELDVAVPKEWSTVTHDFRPTDIWHFAAETPCYSDTKLYLDNNILGTSYAALQCQEHDARMVYTSTDYVFGQTPDALAPYDEMSPLQPWNLYAWSKLGGEAAARLVKDHLVIRGSWYTDFDSWSVAAADAHTSKYYVNLAARDIADLALHGTTGTVHVGMPHARTLSAVTRAQGYNLPTCAAADVDVPTTVALDTTRCQTLLRHLRSRLAV
jgi:dTDP-4-dehydrorhamnose reductase